MTCNGVNMSSLLLLHQETNDIALKSQDVLFEKGPPTLMTHYEFRESSYFKNEITEQAVEIPSFLTPLLQKKK